MNPFFQLDIRVDKKIIYKNWIYSFYIDLQNISWLFYKSPEFEFYNYNYTDKIDSACSNAGTGFKAEF